MIINTKSYFLFFCGLLNFVLADPTVKISGGWLQGLGRQTSKGIHYHTYLGVPFAEPPVGNLRFQEPRPIKPWHGVRKAVEEEAIALCDEDCLYLNVYTPRISPSNDSLLPVMVYIHTGGFVTGNINDDAYVPTWLIEEGLPLTTNYRVGIFGFLSLDIKEAPGNAGLKDQVAVLQWINENIAVFGGDPANVTIFGSDAGAASINYLMVSDRAKGLFHKAIMSSGSALNPWTLVSNSTENAFKVCKALGYPTYDVYEALRFLLNASQYGLLQAIGEPPHSNILSDSNMYVRDIIFLPIIEKKFPGQSEPFLSQSVHSKMESGNFSNIPVMAGFNSADGLDAATDAEKDPILYGLTDANFERYIPREMCLKNGSPKSMSVANEIRQFYYEDQPVNASSIYRFVAIKGDTWFKIGINEMVKLITKYSSQSVFYYRFSFYEPGQTLSGVKSKYDGAGHGDDLVYVFDFLRDSFYNISRVAITYQRMVKFYANFAKWSNPTPEITELIPLKWNPVTRNKLNFMSIDDDLHMSTNPEMKNLLFWEVLIERENNC